MANFILLSSGGYFSYEEKKVDNVTIEDIAYSLSFCCRFVGHCRLKVSSRPIFYSVAEHCVRMSYIVESDLALAALMHEAAEALFGDIPSALKRQFPELRKMEKEVESLLLEKFNVPPFDHAEIKRYDNIMLATERRDLMNWDGSDWPSLEGTTPHGEVIEPWSSAEAAAKFLMRYDELSAHRRSTDIEIENAS